MGASHPPRKAKCQKQGGRGPGGAEATAVQDTWMALRPVRIQPKVPEAELFRCNGPVSFITDSDLGIRHENSSYSKTRLLGKYLAGSKTVGQDAKLEHEA